jgi:hypothetical protein
MADADAATKSLKEPRGTVTADESATLGSVGAALLDTLMSELVVRRPNARRSVTVTRRIWVGDASKCSTLTLRV